MSKRKAIRLMTERIADTGGMIIMTSRDDMIAGAMSGQIAGNMMESFLRNHALHPASEEVCRSALLSIAMLRAIELTETACCAWDEDSVEIDEDNYDRRYALYIRNLKATMEYPTPVRIAQYSSYALTGQGIKAAQTGGNTAAIYEAWLLIQRAVRPFGEGI